VSRLLREICCGDRPCVGNKKERKKELTPFHHFHDHVITNDHCVEWDNTKVILCKESKWSKRKWKEAWMIEQQNNAIANRDDGRTLPEVYEVLIDNDRNVLARDEPTRTCWGAPAITGPYE
jgi:hypothetical protein